MSKKTLGVINRRLVPVLLMPSGGCPKKLHLLPQFISSFFPIILCCELLAPVKMADRPVPVVEKRLMDVKLGELGTWIGARDFTPNGIISAVRRGHDRYYNKYINVKKGGIGGVAMLLVGYVAISYLWEFDHIKHDRWRKYH
uniref:ATP synthase membrane subunit f n=2 Tax=Mastacembelus armatus TaxID=205130 RepID=A0A3Q3RT46_9TELE